MFTSTGVRSLLPALLLFAVAGTMAIAGEREVHRTEVGVLGGFFLPDQDLSNKEHSIQEVEAILGARFALMFASRFDWFVDATFTDVNSDLSHGSPPVRVGDVETQAGRTGISFYFKPHGKKMRWFVSGGGGLIAHDEGGGCVALGQIGGALAHLASSPACSRTQMAN